MQRRRFGTSIDRGDPDQDIVRRCLGIFGEDIEVAALVEDTRIGNLKFGIELATALVFLKKTRIRKLGLWILVKRLHIGMRRRGIEIEIAFLDVFPMIALRPGQTKEAFLENRIPAIP